MLHERVAVVVLAFASVAACSSSGSGSSNSADGSTGGSSGGASSSSGGSGAPNRGTVSCSDVQTGETSAGNQFMTGSWGSIPTWLQMLPPGAMFCGTTTLAGGDGGPHNEQTEIATNLWDQQIFNFYNPIVTANGCTLKPMMTSSSPPVSSTTFDCTNGGGGGIVASGTMQFLDLSYVPPGM